MGLVVGSGVGTAVANYTAFDNTGHQTMVGEAKPWRDEFCEALNMQANGAGLTKNITESTMDFDSAAVYHATFTNADALYTNMQFNHDKDLASPLYPHIHWNQSKNYSPNLLLEYRWQVNGGLKTTIWTKLKCNNLAFPYASGTLDQISYSNPINPPSGSSLSDIVQFRIYRDNTNASVQFSGTDPYNTGGNATVPITFFDCHFQTNSLGSTDQYLK